jgi:hypothetical protein
VLTGARAAPVRWRDGGEERRRFELGARAKEGVRVLGREGKRGGEGRGCSSSFYKGRWSAEEGWPGW